MWLALFQGVSFAMAPLLSFSPFKLFVFSSALRQGWRKSLPLALTPLIADIPIILLIWLILRQIPDAALHALRIAGGLFYIYLAVGLIRRANHPVDAQTVSNSPQRSFWQAITAIWITPQVYINWSVIGVPALLTYGDESPWNAVAFLIGFYVLWVVGLAAQIVIFGQAGKLNQTATRYVIIAASLLLVGFGVYQCWLGAAALTAR
jgi:threonine/homoserine/homoserine lactone efflux protein